MMKYYTRVINNGFLLEVRIARDEHPGAGYIAACKRKFGQNGDATIPPATVWINIGFSGDIDLDEVEAIKRWLNEAAKMARLLDDHVTGLADFEADFEVRQVDGTLLLDKVEPVEADRELRNN